MSPNSLLNMNILVAASLALALSGCAGDLNPVRDVFVVTGIGDTPAERPGFVADTRPERLQYVPVGPAAATRETPPKTDEEVVAMEDELRRLQATNEISASRARGLAMGPPPEPITVEPVPAMSEPPEPIIRQQ